MSAETYPSHPPSAEPTKTSSTLVLISFLYFFSCFRVGALLGAHVIILLLIFYQMVRYPRIRVATAFVLVIFWAKVLYDQFLTAGVTLDLMEALKGYVVLLAGIFLLNTVLVLRDRLPLTTKQVDIFLGLNLVHALFLIIQFFLFNVVGNQSLLNPFGPFSSFGPNPFSDGQLSPYFPAITANTPFIRPNGLNWEPSSAAFWTNFAFTIAITHDLVRRTFSWLSWAIFGVAIALVGSAIGLTHFALMAATYLFLRIRLPGVRIILVSLALLVGLAAFGVTDVSFFEGGRLAELGRVGTSGYLRVTAPLNYLANQGLTLLGSLPLTSTDYIYSTEYSGLITVREYSTIENLYFYIPIYFGLVGAIATIWTAFSMLRKGSSVGLVLCVSFLVSLNYGGHLLNPIFLIAWAMMFIFAARDPLPMSTTTIAHAKR